MSLKPFNGADPSRIISAIQRNCEPEQMVSVQFRSDLARLGRSMSSEISG